MSTPNDSATARSPYRHLSGSAVGIVQIQRLYMTDDHVLCLTRAGTRESYKRFYFADIQAITIQKTSTGAISNAIILAIGGVFAAMAAAGFQSQWDSVGLGVLLALAGVCFFIALINTALGPTCQSHILTAVHEEPLPSVNRLYTAQRVAERLRAAIEAVQGSVGDMGTGIANTAQRVEHAAERRDGLIGARKESGWLHAGLFAVLIANAIAGGAGLLLGARLPVAVYVVPAIVAFGLAFAAAVRQRETDIPHALRSMVWVALAMSCVAAALHFYAYAFNQAAAQGMDAQSEQVAGVMSASSTFAANAINAPVSLAVGATGLYFFWVWRRAVAARHELARVATADEVES